MWHANLFFGIAKFSKLGMQNPFSGLQFAFFACNITFQTCGNDPPKLILNRDFSLSVFLNESQLATMNLYDLKTGAELYVK
jgi:hypothetical protein